MGLKHGSMKDILTNLLLYEVMLVAMFFAKQNV